MDVIRGCAIVEYARPEATASDGAPHTAAIHDLHRMNLGFDKKKLLARSR